MEATYHRFVKTTPKPRATKNSKGELVALFEPEPPPLLPAVVVAALTEADVVVADISISDKENHTIRIE
jgi:hypothetical protein